MTTTTSPQLIEPTPFVSLHDPHDFFVHTLVALTDGSFLSCSQDNTTKRWWRPTTITTTNNNLRLLGTYKGHTSSVWCAVEKDDNTLVTGSDDTLKIWNTTTCECLDTLPMSLSVRCLLRKKDKSCIVCGFATGEVELRRVSDLGVLSSLKLHRNLPVLSICELEDGSVVSGVYNTMIRWDEKGTVLQAFSGHSNCINRVIKLNSDVIVSASLDGKVKMWRVSTGECLRTLTLHFDNVCGLERVNDGVFVSASWSKKMVVWDEKGDCIETHKCGNYITAMTRLRDGSIVTADKNLIEIRQL